MNKIFEKAFNNSEVRKDLIEAYFLIQSRACEALGSLTFTSMDFCDDNTVVISHIDREVHVPYNVFFSNWDMVAWAEGERKKEEDERAELRRLIKKYGFKP